MFLLQILYFVQFYKNKFFDCIYLRYINIRQIVKSEYEEVKKNEKNDFNKITMY